MFQSDKAVESTLPAVSSGGWEAKAESSSKDWCLLNACPHHPVGFFINDIVCFSCYSKIHEARHLYKDSGLLS